MGTVQIFLILVAVLILPMAHAQGPAPGFDLKKYQSLIDLAVKTGDRVQGPDYEYRSLERVAPQDPQKTHVSDYFSAVGLTDSSGAFGAFEVSIESENWVKEKNGDWLIEEWHWEGATDGTLLQVEHNQLTETSDGQVLDMKGLPVGDVSAPAEIARWDAKVNEWIKMTAAIPVGYAVAVSFGNSGAWFFGR